MGLIGKFSAVGSATLASRFLGFFREAMIAYVLGAGPVADAFYAAFRFPNLFRRLFAEGAFNSAFVPLFAGELETGGRQAARAFAEQVLSVLLCILIAISALAMIFMPSMVASVVASRFDPASDKFAMTVDYARVMFPYLTAMSLVAMLSGILNSFRRYFFAALAPVLLNIVLILLLWIAQSRGFSGPRTGLWLAWGVFGSGVLQFALLYAGLRRDGFALRLVRPKMSEPVRRLLWLALPAAVTGGVTQINLLIGQNIASAQPGAIAVMNYADRIFQLPLGVVVVAIGVVLLPELARALAGDDLAEAAKLQNRSLEFGLALMLPATVGLALMPEALVAIVYERGAFSRETTLLAASVLKHFAWGLPAATLIAIFRPGFYARRDMRTPMWFAGANVAINIALSLALFPRMGVAGIAIATSTAQWANAVLLGASLWRRNLFRPSTRTARRLLVVVLASVAMGVALWLMVAGFGAAMLDARLSARAGLVLGAVALAAIIYFAIVVGSGAVALEQFRSAIRRKRGAATFSAPPGNPD